MRLLVLTPRLPWPPDRGDRLRAYHLLATLGRDHEVTLLSAYEQPAELAGLANLEPHARAIHAVRVSRLASLAAVALNAWRPVPLQALYYRSRGLGRALRALAPDSFDAVYLQLFRLAPLLDSATEGAPYRIVDLTDVISDEISRSLPFRSLAGRLLYRFEGRRIAAYEDRLAAAAEEVWVVSEAERSALLARVPRAAVHVIPNGVDSERFAPGREPPVAGRLLFVGHMEVAHNVDAARWLVTEILPRVRAEVPEATLRLVGAGRHPALARLAREPGVEWAGFAPDLAAELRHAAVFVAPLRFSAGLQNKVLEAMAVGRPVVTTAAVQRGLEGTAEDDMLVGDDASSLAAHTVRLLRDPALGRRLGAAARRRVAARFTWDHARRRLRALEAERAAAGQRL